MKKWFYKQSLPLGRAVGAVAGDTRAAQANKPCVAMHLLIMLMRCFPTIPACRLPASHHSLHELAAARNSSGTLDGEFVGGEQQSALAGTASA